MKLTYFVLWLMLILIALYMPAISYADEELPPHDYSKTTSNGQYVFVMLAGDNYYTVKDEALREKYSQSGLYRNDGSTTPLWIVDWYASDVEISSDGHHLVKYGPWPSGSRIHLGNYGELAFAFYDDGREIQSYQVGQLVSVPILLPHSVSHYMWLRKAFLDDSQGILHVETELGEKYAFDIASGTPIDGIVLPWPRCLNIIVPLIVIFIGFIGFRLLRRRRRLAYG